MNAEGVEVFVEDGTAQLTGTVASYAVKVAATDNAFAAGAVWVDNDLIVRQ